MSSEPPERRLTSFAAVLAQRWSRRDFLATAAGSGLLAGAAFAPASTRADDPETSTTRHGAAPSLPRLAPSRRDAFELAPGYRHDLIASWGDPLWPGDRGLDAATLRRGGLLEPGAAAAQARRFGTNCDGIAFFPLGEPNSRRGLLCVNHEYVNLELCFTGLPRDARERVLARPDWIRRNPDAVAWMQAAHGVSVLQVERDRRGRWRHIAGSRHARRITATTSCDLQGPARGHALLRTRAEPTGTRALGTFANCAGGRTPWGTYLTSEENIDDYFGGASSWLASATTADDLATRAAHARFPLPERSAYGWEHADPRFDLRQEPREALRCGWIVEIDPYEPSRPPRKRTALGRFSHEGANTLLAHDGRVAAYMGDDDPFEYVYKFVTRDRFEPRDPAANRDLLDAGTLYVARFDADGRGTWLPLVYDEQGPLNAAAGFRDQGEVLIKCRAAADLLGATPMDRPEDIEPSPVSGRIYIACTNNGARHHESRHDTWTNRRIDLGADAANPRPLNDFGHIIELLEADDDAAATQFHWNVFLLAGNPGAAGSRLLTDRGELVAGRLERTDTYYAGYADASQLSPFACPDNLAIDPQGRLWIVTDGNPNLVAHNGCFVVPTDGPDRGLLRQIASGPTGSELAGCEFTPDGRTLFLSIQHPGEGGTIDNPVSDWPDGHGLPARSGLVALTREDGAPL
ncbi:MAG: PhoX family phosphatase [Steroidobacteraceae bacterium]|nr:PhoX family phosphatase [Nevskiaceae bacterium]MCP5471074.1 PhoX family phosphatase [Nevskiaceae bacterium]